MLNKSMCPFIFIYATSFSFLFNYKATLFFTTNSTFIFSNTTHTKRNETCFQKSKSNIANAEKKEVMLSFINSLHPLKNIM